MSKIEDWRLAHTVEIVKKLQETAAAFRQREEALTKELQGRRVAITRTGRDGIDRAEARAATLLGEMEAQSQREQTRITWVYEQRRARVERVAASGMRGVPKRAQEAKQRWMGDLQRRKFRAERKLATERQAANATHAAFAYRLAEQQSALTLLERQTVLAFRGYPQLTQMLSLQPQAPSDAVVGDAEQLLEMLRVRVAAAAQQLTDFRQLTLPRTFSEFRASWIALLALAVSGFVVVLGQASPNSLMLAAVLAVVLNGAVWLAHRSGLTSAQPYALPLATTLAEARQLLAAAEAEASQIHAAAISRAEAEFEETRAGIDLQWERADEIEAEFAEVARTKIGRQAPRLLEKIESVAARRLSGLETASLRLREQVESEAAGRVARFRADLTNDSADLAEAERIGWTELERDWKQAIDPLYAELDALRAATRAVFPAWDEVVAEEWTPAAEAPPAVLFAQLEVTLNQAPKSSHLPLPGSAHFSAPLSLTFPDQGSLLFETNDSGDARVISALENIILRLLASTPPGKLAFTIIDPVGLGQNFAGLMHLGDYEESLINRRIWTQRDQIEERLAELSAHIEKVIQMYLRNEYATITDYNQKAGSVAEKYHFLVIADFPVGFSETAARRLQSIATSGPRCGIFTLIHWDQRHPLPDGFVPDELRKNSICLRGDKAGFQLVGTRFEDHVTLQLDPAPEPDRAIALIHRIGRASIDSNRVEVPFTQIAPSAGELWSGETTNELRIAIGRTGATKHQYLAIGKGTRQHALFAGKTGSGKSTLFHVIITNLALACSPDQVEFYLIDFKKGVEFKCYAQKRLPHARVIAIESDREFALSVLQRVDDELKRRGDLFRALGVQDVAGYKKAGGTEPMPRSLLLIDEFQEFFVEDDTIAQTASLLFDRIVRQGRAFGIHVLLGSQTLGGAYSLARATLGQMVIRVALQCNEADAYLIMDDSNPAPRLLSRPGEGIYNDAAGAIEGNSPFQVVWLPDEERDQWLDRVARLAQERLPSPRRPIVFEGNAPADLAENEPLRLTLHSSKASEDPAVPRVWLGAPNAIKGPTEAIFRRQSGHHLLIVGQREDASLSMLAIAMLSLAAQFAPGGVRLMLLHHTVAGSPESEVLERVLAAIPHSVSVSRGGDAGPVLDELSRELQTRASNGEYSAGAPSVFLFVHSLHKFKKLRQEDDFSFSVADPDAPANPAAQLTELITEGSSHGIHLLVSVDTFNNVNRAMSRKLLSEFEMRVVFQMSANDSASLIDSPKASGLGLHRALFFNEHEGSLETFRPYAAPAEAWLQAAAEKLRDASTQSLAGPEPKGAVTS